MKILEARKLWFAVSALLIIGSITAVAFWGLQIGVDFKGGQLLEARYNDTVVEVAAVREAVTTATEQGSVAPTSVVEIAPQTFQLRTSTEQPEQLAALRSALGNVGEWQEIRFENVGPTVGADLTRKAIWAVALASVAIILYVAWAFRGVRAPASSWRFGVLAIITLFHDLIVMVGAYAVLGHFYGFEVDALFITALLTIMGYSVNDTIVTYDRIRENLKRHPHASFESVVNRSVLETLIRSLNASLTLFLVLVSLLVLGGTSVRPFISALLVGTIVGSYSSIFVAAQLLIVWQHWSAPRNATQPKIAA